MFSGKFFNAKSLYYIFAYQIIPGELFFVNFINIKNGEGEEIILHCDVGYLVIRHEEVFIEY